MAEPHLIKTPVTKARFWDKYVTTQFKTEDGFKAKFGPTKGGSATSWQNREVIFSLEIKYSDGRIEIKEIAAGLIKSITTKRSSPLAIIKIGSLTKSMQIANAEKVKDGAQWYENKELSFVINKLMEQVFKDSSGNLPENRRLISELIKIRTIDNKLGWWTHGVPPGWDGGALIPSPDATPATAMCTNADKSKLYIGLGGGGSYEPELWEYDIDQNIWTLLATTNNSDTNTQYAQIQKLFFNTYDGKIYGILWKDFGDTQSNIENNANKLNWICPPARMFYWDPGEEETGDVLNDSNHSTDLGNIFPGDWDIREMFMVDSAGETGWAKNQGPSPTSDGGPIKNESETYKMDYRASVGNFTAFKYIHMPFGTCGQEGGNTGQWDVEPRRAAVRYHPRPANGYESDPLMQTWGNSNSGTAKGEMIPTTLGGSTAWTNAAGATPPDGFVKKGDPTFSLAAGILTITHNSGSGSDYGFFGGGYNGGASNIIDYIDITTTSGNATDKGNLTVARNDLAGNNGSTYGFFGGGFNGGYSNIIDYIDITTTSGNATDKGILTVGRRNLAGNNGSTYGFFGGGYTLSGSYSDIIDYIDITTTLDNALDKGILTIGRRDLAGNNGSTYGFFGGGDLAGVTNIIDYIDITITSGNATDKGDLTVGRHEITGNNGSIYGFFAGGFAFTSRNEIDYIDITTTSGNATDKGILTVARSPAGNNGSTYGFFGGGPYIIDYIDITTTSGNATDKGNLTVSRGGLGANDGTISGGIKGLNLTIEDVEANMTVYRFRIEGGSNFEIFVGNSTGAHSENSVPYGPLGALNTFGYSNEYYGNGDYFFSVLKTSEIPGMDAVTQKNIYIGIRPRNALEPTIVLNNLSLTVARYWNRWSDINRQAGENIPITNYNKIIAGVTVRTPTHGMSGSPARYTEYNELFNWLQDYGPGFEEYDEDVSGITTRQNLPNNKVVFDQRNEEIILEFNLIAQHRKLLKDAGNPLADWATEAYNPMYGPSEVEDGITPDNSKRYIIGSRNIKSATQGSISIYGFFGGGYRGSTSLAIDYIDITTTIDNALDKGDLTVARTDLAGCNGPTYGFFAGGMPSYSNVIDYIDLLTASGNALNKGGLVVGRTELAGCNGPVYGFFAGGQTTGVVHRDEIDYIDTTITITDALDKGNLVVARSAPTGCNGPVYGFFAGGYTGSYRDEIDYIDITTTIDNASDKGNLVVARRNLAGCNGSTYGFFAGGYTGSYRDEIDSFDITTNTGNAIDRGNLTVSRRGIAGCNGDTYGFFAGGWDGSSDRDIIDYIDITTISVINALDKGNLIAGTEGMGSNDGAGSYPTIYKSDNYSNEARIVDLAPNRTQSGPPDSWTGERDYKSDSYSMQSGRHGHGYVSIHAQAIGERALDGTVTNNLEIGGIIRFTNGQQGFLVFSQEADQGKGVIMYATFDGTQPNDNYYFMWGPGGSGRFQIKWSIFKCIDKTLFHFTSDQTAFDSTDIPTRISRNQAPYLTGGWESLYPTAGCVDNAGNFYIGVIATRSHTALYTGSNPEDVVAKSYIFKIPIGIGAFSTNITGSYVYTSSSDVSEYNEDGGAGCYGNLSDNYNGESAINKTRKFMWFHFNPDFASPNKIIGVCFKRDSILVDPDDNPGTPCHEIFVFDSSISNKLLIIDHDIQDGLNTDSVGFMGLVNTTGKIGIDTSGPGENVSAVWYFRQQKGTPIGQTFEHIGEGLKLCYMYEDSSNNIIGGQFWDNEADSGETKLVRHNEGFLGNKIAVSALIDMSLDSEREVIFSTFDHWISYYHIADRSALLSGSGLEMFRIDDKNIDPILPLFDFTGLKVFDAISKLANAYNFVFGFDIEKFFLLPRDGLYLTHTLHAADGDIKDIEKVADDDIRNVISIQPYSPIIQNVDWEITHVGDETVLEDETLFNGDLIMNIKSHKALSMNLICTRQGRLIMNEADTAVVDAVTNPENRYIPLFRWKTNAPTKSVVLLKALGSDTTIIYLNTVFSIGNDPIVKGDILVFVNQTTFEQVGRVIIDINSNLSTVTLEAGVGFSVDRLTPLIVASAHVGSSIDSNNKSKISTYGTNYSDDGVCIIKSISSEVIDGNTHTTLVVNNITPFRNFKFKIYDTASYKHYSFLVTTYVNPIMRSTNLPPGALGSISSLPMAWVYDVDLDSMIIKLNGIYSAFQTGQILRLHYALQPAALIDEQVINPGTVEPSPYTGVIQDLPGGIASWHWVCDEITDKFNVGDIINFHFKGIRLIKDDGAIYTGANMKSVNQYGERAWSFPDNRFMSHDMTEHWLAKFLQNYAHPKYKIIVTAPFISDITFMNPAGNLLRKIKIVDELMFPGMKEFSTSGYLKNLSINLKNFSLKFEYTSEEQY